MRQPDYSGQFKRDVKQSQKRGKDRDVKQSQKRGKDMDKLKVLLGLLINGNPLPSTYLDHPLNLDPAIDRLFVM